MKAKKPTTKKKTVKKSPAKKKTVTAPKKKPLDYRKAKILKAIIEHPELPLSEIGRKAGYKEGYIQAGNFYKRHGKTRLEKLQKALEDQGMTEEVLARKILEGTEATKTSVHVKTVSQSGEAEKRTFKHETIKIEQVDFPTRAKYLDMVRESLGVKIDRIAIEDNETAFNPSLADLSLDQLKKMKDIMKKGKKPKE